MERRELAWLASTGGKKIQAAWRAFAWGMLRVYMRAYDHSHLSHLRTREPRGSGNSPYIHLCPHSLGIQIFVFISMAERALTQTSWDIMNSAFSLSHLMYGIIHTGPAELTGWHLLPFFSLNSFFMRSLRSSRRTLGARINCSRAAYCLILAPKPSAGGCLCPCCCANYIPVLHFLSSCAEFRIRGLNYWQLEHLAICYVMLCSAGSELCPHFLSRSSPMDGELFDIGQGPRPQRSWQRSGATAWQDIWCGSRTDE